MKTAPAGTKVGFAGEGVQSKEFDWDILSPRMRRYLQNFHLFANLEIHPATGVGDAVHFFAGLRTQQLLIASLWAERFDTSTTAQNVLCLLPRIKRSFTARNRFRIAQLNNQQRFVVGCGECRTDN
jgi:hypothetical protein